MKMIFNAKISHIICTFAFVLSMPRFTLAYKAEIQELITGMDHFATRLFTELAKTKEYAQKNILFSPFSIQTCITMARMGAEGKTASQIDQAFGLPGQERKHLADKYNAILADYEDSTIFKMANKMYAMSGLRAQDEFNELLTKQFDSSVEFLNFAKNEAAAQTINSWVEERTNSLIQNLVDPNSFDAATRLVLVNAIHFKGNWVHQFPEFLTRENDFYLDNNSTTKVQMMHVMEYFNYADLPGLNAAAVELPYKDGDLSMLVILPKTPTSLAELENKLENISLTDITQQMRSTKVALFMPKFKAEFQAELSEPLSKMGLERIFSADAEFGKMLIPKGGLQVSSVVHKAFIEVNERGTEAAAATSLDFEDRIASSPKLFKLNRPFHYVIKNAVNLVLFKGNFKNNV